MDEKIQATPVATEHEGAEVVTAATRSAPTPEVMTGGNMDQRIGWPTGIVALGFLTLVGLMFWRATENMSDFDKIWAVAGPVLGVVVGAIPGFFFAQTARRDQQDAHLRAEAYAAVMPDENRPVAMEMLRSIRNTAHT